MRFASKDDFRSNISKGGSTQATKLNASERRRCEKIAKALVPLGVYFAGLDLICGFVTEINISCPAGIVEINKLTGSRLERKILDFVENE